MCIKNTLLQQLSLSQESVNQYLVLLVETIPVILCFTYKLFNSIRFRENRVIRVINNSSHAIITYPAVHSLKAKQLGRAYSQL